MDFTDFLISQKPAQEWTETTEMPRELFRLFAPLEVGTFTVSIQASALHHCSPQEELEADQYESFEVCITEGVNGQEKLVDPVRDERFMVNSWVDYWIHDDHFMAGYYVPRDVVTTIMETLEGVSSS